MKGVSFKHWLSEYPFAPPVPDSHMAELLRRVRQGDSQAINEMIEGHLRLANSIVARYLMTSNRDVKSVDVEELVAAAFYATVYAVNRIASGFMTHDNVGGYIAEFLHQKLHAALKERSIICNPRGLEDPVLCCQLSECDSEQHGKIEPDTSLEVDEEVESIVNDVVDAKIVRMLRLGYCAADVARDLGVHKGTVSRRIQRIRENYMESLQ
jgi:DNA-directed RNA polymerase specialized sigma24 family protein